jgi:precorrin-4/cobalt-precorrin-4 C11-methyltransferase
VLNAEYTLPGVSQTVIITRIAGRTPVPQAEEIAALAAHKKHDGDFFERRHA